MSEEQAKQVQETVSKAIDTASETVPEQMHIVTEKLAEWLNIDASMVWVTQIFVIILATLILSFFANQILKRIHRRFEKTKTDWDDTLVEAARKPLRTLIWVLGLCYAIEIIYKETQAEIFSAIDAVRDVGVIATITWWLVRFIKAFELNLIKHKQEKGEEIDHTTLEAVSKLIRLAVLITSGLVILQTLGFSVSGVLAFGGIGGIAVGFAARDLLANFFGAFMIYFDRPFSVGDWIRSPDKEIEGTVENIGWRLTRIRTFDKRPLYVPNALFTTIIVENPSRMLNRRIFETIGIRYDDMEQMQAITDEVRDMLQHHEEIDQNQTLMVHFDAFNASSIDFFVYCFTKTTKWTEYHAVKHDVLLGISNVITSHGAEIAFPTRTLHVPEGVMLPGLEEQKAKPAPKRKKAEKA